MQIGFADLLKGHMCLKRFFGGVQDGDRDSCNSMYVPIISCKPKIIIVTHQTVRQEYAFS